MSPAKPGTSRAPMDTTAPPTQPLDLSAGKHGVEHDKGVPSSPIGVSVLPFSHHHILTLIFPKLKKCRSMSPPFPQVSITLIC